MLIEEQASIAVSCSSFVVTAIAFLAWKRFGQEDVMGIKDTTSISLSKEQVLHLRRKHYCRSVSISYSNSSGLMIVGVRS